MQRHVLHLRILWRRRRIGVDALDALDASNQHGFALRRARRSDAATLVEFNLSLAEESESLSLDRARVERGVRAALEDAAKGEYLLAERAGEVVAALLVTREWSDWRAGWAWWIQSVYVRPSARRAGAYRALHEATLARARSQGAVALRLYVDRNNLPAQRTYERVGMRRSHYELFEADDGLRP